MSSLVERLIAENRASKDPFLDLGNCGLSRIPDAVFELHWLRELNLSNEWWEWSEKLDYRTRCGTGNDSDLNNIHAVPPAIAKLHRLSRLWLNGDVQRKFALSDIEPLAELKNLKVLGLSATRVKSLRPLAKLIKLEYLDLWNAEEVASLDPLSALNELRILDIWGTRVQALGPLARLPKLQFLNIGSTRVKDLFPVLTMLERGASVKFEPPEYDVSGLYIEDTDVQRPPPEIVESGTESIKLFFRESQAQGEDHLYEAKVLIVGEGGAGKTSLLRRLYLPNEPLPAEGQTTKGIEIHKHYFDMPSGRQFRLNVWDFGGQEIYHSTHQFFLTKRSLYILVDDTRRDHRTVHDEGFKYWLEVVEALSNRSPVLVFQNEKGGRSKAIDERGIRERFRNVLEFFGGDLDKHASVAKIRQGIEYHVQRLPHVGEALPAKWLLIRGDIEKESRTRPFVSETTYFEIYARHLPFDKTRALHLSRYLHDLGVFLHFQDDPLLRRTVILQNAWATEAVFRMFDSNAVKSKFGRFNGADCTAVWGDSIYSDMHLELLALMQKFELCYPLPDSRPPTWLAPQLLPPSRPKELERWEHTGDLEVRYRYEFMPKGIVNRLMVRQHRFVKRPELGWVSGVLFEHDGTEVLVAVSTSGTDIVLRGRGTERKELLAVISSELEAINESFHGVTDRIQKLIPCRCAQCAPAQVPEFFGYARLLQRKKDKKLHVECPRSYLEVGVLELLDGVRVTQMPDWSRGLRSSEDTGRPRSRQVSIFLASSASLITDRNDFDLYFRQRNDDLRKAGVYLKIERWERLSSALAHTRKQDDHNRRVIESDIFVCLIATRAGEYTREEFKVAYDSFITTGKPAIFTFFKNEKVDSVSIKHSDLTSVRDFQDELRRLGHFWSIYNNIDELILKFQEQLGIWIQQTMEQN